MEIIILAGGFGTRLQNVVNNVPKPMANINGKPFLAYLLEYVCQYDVSNIILSVGYKQDIVKAYFQDSINGINIQYCSEEVPLGTGGALKKSLNLIKSNRCLVLNGDSLFKIDLDKFYSFTTQAKIAIAVKMMFNFDRYGSVEIEKDRIISFAEKTFTEAGYVNTGIYMVSKDIFDGVDDTIFSFEAFLQNQENILGYIQDDYFIDIGIPKDYEQAKKDFKELF